MDDERSERKRKFTKKMMNRMMELASSQQDAKTGTNPNVLVDIWLRRYADVMENDAQQLGAETKASLLIEKLEQAEYSHSTNLILTKKPNFRPTAADSNFSSNMPR